MYLVAGTKEILAGLVQFSMVGQEELVAAIEGIELLQHKKPTLALREIRHQGIKMVPTHGRHYRQEETGNCR